MLTKLLERRGLMAERRRVFETQRVGDTLVLSPRGDSLGVEERELRNEIDALHQLIQKPDVVHLVVDVGSAAYFSSLVIGAVMALCQRVHEAGGRAVWCNASPGMYDVLQIMKLDTVMPYYRTREEALAAIRSGE
ncbi:MAG: STAS domain-containing protein [Planctomycetaceae bacterium]